MRNIVAIAVEKVQRYIFQKIDNSQRDRKTLANIIAASNQVAEAILEEIKEEFNISLSSEEGDNDTILWISGKVVFYSELSKEQIYEKCKRLFENVYKDYQGQIFLKYAVFEDKGSAIENLRQSDLELKSAKNRARVLKENQRLLFQFTELENSIESERTKKSLYEEWEQVFVADMDDLVVQDQKHDSESTDGKIAIVKADINHLGRIMSGFDSFEVYKKISKLLKDKITIKNFEECIERYSQQIENAAKNESQKEIWTLRGRILPFYIAGDDIFYATRIDGVIDSIKVLRNMVGDLNEEIKTQTEGKISIDLSLAVGVVFVNNHQPVRYYRQLVEKELDFAKTTMKTKKDLQAAVGISMAGNSFYIYKKGYGLGEKDSFYRFGQEVDELKDMLAKNVFTNTALHNLLINLEIEQDKKQQLFYALYFLRPNLQKGQLVNNDMYFKYYWLSQLVEDSTGQEAKEEKDFELEKINNILIPKIKLVLLFLREKYSKPVEEVEYKYIISKDTKEQEKKVYSVMLNKPLNHLLGSMNKESYKHNPKSVDDQLVHLFIKVEKKDGKQLYPSADFQPSVFYRAKNLIENGKREVVYSLFKNYNQGMQQKMIKKDDNILVKNETIPKQNEKQEKLENPHRISFDIETFKTLYKKSNGIRWLDTLILAFHYNQQRIIVKTVKKAKKKNKSGKETKTGRSHKSQKGDKQKQGHRPRNA